MCKVYNPAFTIKERVLKQNMVFCTNALHPTRPSDPPPPPPPPPPNGPKILSKLIFTYLRYGHSQNYIIFWYADQPGAATCWGLAQCDPTSVTS